MMMLIGMVARGALAFGAIYLLGAFVAWDMNAGDWEAFTRGTFAWFGGGAALMAAIIPAIE